MKSFESSPDTLSLSRLYLSSVTHALSQRRLTVTQSGVTAGMWDNSNNNNNYNNRVAASALWETQLSEDVARRLVSEKEKKLLLSPEALSPSASVLPDGQGGKLVVVDDGVSNISKETMMFLAGRKCAAFNTGLRPGYSPALDPLHFRSLFMLSLSIFAPKLASSSSTSSRFPFMNGHVKEMSGSAGAYSTDTLRPGEELDGEDKVSAASSSASNSQQQERREWRIWRWGLAIVGVFCAGVGFGLAFS